MKRNPPYFALLLLLLNTLHSTAQDTTLLRLHKLPDDTTKINSLISYGKLNRSNPDKAIPIYNEALAIAQKINDEDGVARAILGLAFINLSTGNFNECIRQYETAVHIKSFGI